MSWGYSCYNAKCGIDFGILRIMNKPKAILFDWDNTLIDNNDILLEAMNTALTTCGMPIMTQAQYLSQPHISIRDSFKTELSEERAELARKVFHNHLAEKITLNGIKTLPQSAETLEHISKLGIKMAVVSNKRGDILRDEVAQLGWGKHFLNIVGAEDAERDKPSNLPVLFALKDSGIRPEDSWFIGDSQVDLECARNSGCFAVIINNPSLAADIHVSNHLELINLISQNFK